MSIRKVGAAVALLGAFGLGPGNAAAQDAEQAQQQQAPVVESKFANVNGARLHYLLQAGQGDPVVLLHGFGQSRQMWRPLMRELATDHIVVAVDLRGAGQSDAPEEGYAKSTMAGDVHELMRLLGYDKVSVVGHGIGTMVAYAYAAQFPAEVENPKLNGAAPFIRASATSLIDRIGEPAGTNITRSVSKSLVIGVRSRCVRLLPVVIAVVTQLDPSINR